VAIGNFDGLHRGHQKVIATARDIARAQSRQFAVLTFEPHPRAFFGNADAPFRLTPFRIKVREFQALGVEQLFVLRFNKALSQCTAEQFVSEFLHGGIASAHIVVGYNFKFGSGRDGDFELLTRRGAELGFDVTCVDPACDDAGEVYSSTLIRKYLTNGKPQRAAALLGHLWEVEGRVGMGRQLGRTIGFPTANVDMGEAIRPTRGVYTIRGGVGEGDNIHWYDGVANIGVRPTVDGEKLVLEAHLFDFDADIYGRYLRVALVDFLRPEQKFDGIDRLTAQIAEDSRQARELLQARALGAGDFVGEDV
ncbi:MAG TPA: riboflavin biosynthesis protein RibF, partial [Rhodospirillaceae bacterium]|nr:riboflavin biosynthesis protein RibF [Rhodospirillaceae bacterium]